MSDNEIPRAEHPRPQFRRESWVNLNGTWTFCYDPGKSGEQRGLRDSRGFDHEILVPFCPESRLSGIGNTDFIEAMWYHREIDVPADWAGKRLLLHFGAVDYETEVFIDGQSLGVHFGGTASFRFDVTSFASPGRHHLVVRVFDDTRGGDQPGGKQSQSLRSRGARYTRTTGIWQTVWLEAVAKEAIRDVHIVPDLDNHSFVITPTFYGAPTGCVLSVEMAGREVARGAAGDGVAAIVEVDEPRSWRPGDPHLYGIGLELLRDGRPIDRVDTYAGLRKVHVEGNRIFLNNEPIYQRLVLDQGYYPDGIWTAPTDDALKKDIELSMAAGFNGARLHQKVFEERFHYWADRLGYLTWAESSSWGCTTSNHRGARNFMSEWPDIVTRDRNHPSIIAWTPFNETWNVGDSAKLHHRLHADIYDLTHKLDPTRPVNDSSGGIHVKTDLWTEHNYDQDPKSLRKTLTPAKHAVWVRSLNREFEYAGQPYVLDEFGGIKWVPQERRDEAPQDAWGYGQEVQSLEEFYERLEGLVDAVLSVDHICGYCYTQLTDIEQECNGIYFYDRRPKFDMARVKAIFTKTR